MNISELQTGIRFNYTFSRFKFKKPYLLGICAVLIMSYSETIFVIVDCWIGLHDQNCFQYQQFFTTLRITKIVQLFLNHL